MSERILNVDHQKTVEYNGRKFRSYLELQTAKTLDELGISYQYEEKKIILQEGFRCPYQKEKVRDLTYTPDFIIGPIMLECKGFETPEWKIKKKLLFKWLIDNEPETIFYQIHDAKKSLLQVLSKHLEHLNYAIEVTSKPKKKKTPAEVRRFNSIEEAMLELNLKGKNVGPILNSLTGHKQYVYNYNWKLVNLKTLS